MVLEDKRPDGAMLTHDEAEFHLEHAAGLNDSFAHAWLKCTCPLAARQQIFRLQHACHFISGYYSPLLLPLHDLNHQSNQVQQSSTTPHSKLVARVLPASIHHHCRAATNPCTRELLQHMAYHCLSVPFTRNSASRADAFARYAMHEMP
eukprot:366260-Chlamydomonas_euryale.AAC.13